MARFHVNPNTGNSSECKAAVKGCPFGGESGEENHYSTAEEATAAAEKLMADSYSTVKIAYRKKDNSALGKMNRELKKRIINEANEGKNDLHPSVVAKVFSKDNDELIRRNVAQKFKSQKILREMSTDESAKVRASIAKATNNPKVLEALANDVDKDVRNIALKNPKTPVRATKTSSIKKASSSGIKTSPKVEKESSTERHFGDNVNYGDSNHIEIGSALNSVRTVGGNTGFTISDSGENWANVEYKELSDDNKTKMGFSKNDTVVPFVEIDSKRNRVFQQTGFNVNGESSYGQTYVYEASNGRDLKRLLDTIPESKNANMKTANKFNLSKNPPKDKIEKGDIKYIQTAKERSIAIKAENSKPENIFNKAKEFENRFRGSTSPGSEKIADAIKDIIGDRPEEMMNKKEAKAYYEKILEKPIKTEWGTINNTMKTQLKLALKHLLN